jgi:hypothetical integral membrane protein (TIGR02206 family)
MSARESLETFGPVHLAIVVAVPLAAWALAALVAGRPRAARGVELGLAAVLAAAELAWYGHLLARGAVDPPHGLPLDLCDVALWLTVYALASGRRWAREGVYYVGLAGSGMALLTPDVGAAFPSYGAVMFFAAHGGVVAAGLFLVLTGALRPRPGSWWRAFLAVNAYAAAIALVNLRFGTNYMYLCAKPDSATLLDLLGPWPWYVLGGEVVAAALLWAMHLPFRRTAGVA